MTEAKRLFTEGIWMGDTVGKKRGKRGRAVRGYVSKNKKSNRNGGNGQ